MFPYLNLAKTGKNQWWRYLIGIIVILFCSEIIGFLPTNAYLNSADTSELKATQIYDYRVNLNFRDLGLDPNLGLALLISSFLIALIALYLVIRFIHKRSFWTMVNGLNRIRWSRLLFGLVLWGLFSLLMSGYELFSNIDSITYQFQWSRFLPLILIAIFLLPIQTSFEEFFFRGYLTQGIFILTKYPIVAILVSSLLFAGMHGANPEVMAYGVAKMMTYYFVIALFLGLLCLFDDGIEMALGVHAMNNILTAIMISYDDSVIQTDAIWKAESYSLNWWTIIFYIVFAGLFLFLADRVFWRKPKQTEV